MPNQPDCTPTGVKNLRDVRYCEVIPVTQTGEKITSWIYNTLCLNDCPEQPWNALTNEEAEEEYKVDHPDTIDANKNGPRYWVMDQLDAGGSSTQPIFFPFGGIEMQQRAAIDTKVGEPTVGEGSPWQPFRVKRDTVYTYKAGELIYQMTSPRGEVYVMQSYSQQVEHLTIDDLSSLGPRLKFPEPGWTYVAYPLKEELQLSSNGLATVINDNFYNTYQLQT